MDSHSKSGPASSLYIVDLYVHLPSSNASNTALSTISGTSPMWLLDSVCCNHMTSSPDIIPSHTSTSLPTIYTTNGSPMHVSHMIMPKNIKPINLPLFYINLVLFLIPLVQALLSKMAGLSANFIIFLTLFVLLKLSLLLLLSFGGKLLLLPFTPSIGVLLPLFRIKHLMICCLVLLPSMAYLESLDVSVLFFFMIMKETNFSLTRSHIHSMRT